MKTILTIVIAMCFTIGVNAQRGHGLGGSRVVVVSPGISYGIGYSPYLYFSPFGLSPFGYPYGYNNRKATTSKLQSQIEGIKSDYKDKIWSAKHDTRLSKEERKSVIRDLKTQRDKDVQDAKMNYHKSPPVQKESPGNNS